jgi:tetratricopeptide (TPR) repeat protein/DNA-binding CsgD family transcriptional regulator
MRNSIHVLLLLSYFCLTSNLAKAETFPDLNHRLSSEKSIERLKKEMLLEKEQFHNTNDSIHLLKSKLIESFVVADDKIHKLKVLIWLEQNSGKNKSLTAISCFHIAYIFEDVGATKLAQKYAFKVYKLSKKSHFLRQETTQLIASSYFLNGNYSLARKYYLRALHESKPSNHLFNSSNNNNIALCLLREKKYWEAEKYFRKSFEILTHIKHKTKEEKQFMYIVEGNIGTNCYYQKKYGEAIQLLEKELNHCLYGESDKDEISSPLTQLLDIYTITNNKSRQQYLITVIDSLIHTSPQNGTEYPMYLKILYDHAVSTGDLITVNKLSPVLLQKITAYNTAINASTNELINTLYEDRLEHYSAESATRKQLLNQAVSSQKLTQLLFVITLTVGILIISLLVFQYRNKQKNLLKDVMIDKQQQQLVINENVILEREIQLQQEKITSLAMNLSIKKETEKVFLNKLNEIKRKKTIDTVEVIQELQLIVNNLLNIDEKMVQGSIEANQIDRKFKINLTKLHPELTNEDIQFCCYFKLKLSAKEIGSIHGLSDVSVRVLKNKIKRKIGLTTAESLNNYLNSKLLLS